MTHHSLRSTLTVTFTLLACLTTLTVYTALTQTTHAAPTTCNTLTNSMGIPNGFGTSYSFFSGTKDYLLSVLCDTNALTITAGNNNPATWVYDTGYLYQNSQWTPYTLSCTGKSGSWCPKQATKTITNPPSDQYNYLVAYTCEWSDNAWKCGCQDKNCNTAAWQLQVYSPQTSGGGGTTGGEGGTTGGEGGTTGGQGGATPTLVSYLGDNSTVEIVDDQGRDVAVDAAGNMYITGGLDRFNNGLFKGSSNRRRIGNLGGEDIFVIKLSPSGQVLYATLLGGPNYDRPYAIEVDRAGNAYVAGRAGPGFPTTSGSLQKNFAGDDNPNGAYGKQDGFVAKLNTNGSLAWATYVGAGGPGFIRDLDVDGSGNTYLAVTNTNKIFPHVTQGAFDNGVRPSGLNSVIIKLNSAGSNVVWGGYLGGNGDSGIRPSIRVGNSGDVFVLYKTLSGGERTTSGVVQRSLAGGSDVYLARINPSGTSLVYATYLGGKGNEDTETHHLEVDSQNRAYVAIPTATTNFPLPASALQRTSAGGNDALLLRVSADAKAIEAGTYYGGSKNEHVEGIAIDEQRGHVAITGNTYSSNLPITTGSAPSAGRMNAYMAVFDVSFNSNSLLHASAPGGSGKDELRGVAIDSVGAVIATGRTSSSDLQTVQPIQSAYGGGPYDAWFLRVLLQ